MRNKKLKNGRHSNKIKQKNKEEIVLDVELVTPKPREFGAFTASRDIPKIGNQHLQSLNDVDDNFRRMLLGNNFAHEEILLKL